MSNGHSEKLLQLSKGISALNRAIQNQNTQDLKELILLIKKRGWTTPAEINFAVGIVDALKVQLNLFAQLKNTLIKGSKLVNTKY